MLAGRREQTASATIDTCTPRPSRSSAVSSTHTWASTPVRITGAASSSRRRSAKPPAPQAVCWRPGASSRSPRSSGSVWPSPFGYCSVTTTGLPRRRAVASRIFRLRTISSRRSASIAPNRRSCTSVTTRTGCGMGGPSGAETAAYCATTRPAAADSGRLGPGGATSVFADQAGDGRDQVGRFQRLGHVHLESCGERPRSILGPRVGRHGKGGDRSPLLGLLLPELLNEHVAVITGKTDVAHQDVRMPAFHLLECLLGAGGRHDISAGGSQDHAHQLARVGLVIDDEDAQPVESDGLAIEPAARRLGRNRVRVRGGEGKVDGEDGSAALARALGIDVPAVQLDDVTHNGEAEPEAAVSAADRCLALTEAIEDERKELAANALARVADGDPRHRGATFEPDIDAAARRRELDRVGEEVPDHLLQTAGIGRHRAEGRIQTRLQPNAFGIGGGLYRF